MQRRRVTRVSLARAVEQVSLDRSSDIEPFDTESGDSDDDVDVSVRETNSDNNPDDDIAPGDTEQEYDASDEAELDGSGEAVTAAVSSDKSHVAFAEVLSANDDGSEGESFSRFFQNSKFQKFGLDLMCALNIQPWRCMGCWK